MGSGQAHPIQPPCPSKILPAVQPFQEVQNAPPTALEPAAAVSGASVVAATLLQSGAWRTSKILSLQGKSLLRSWGLRAEDGSSLRITIVAVVIIIIIIILLLPSLRFISRHRTMRFYFLVFRSFKNSFRHSLHKKYHFRTKDQWIFETRLAEITTSPTRFHNINQSQQRNPQPSFQWPPGRRFWRPSSCWPPKMIRKRNTKMPHLSLDTSQNGFVWT